MKIITFVLLLIMAHSILYAQSGAGIEFQQSGHWADILHRARKENKYIFVDVYTTWCSPCKQMDHQVYSNQKLGVLMAEKFVSIKVQMDTTANDNEHVQAWYKDAEVLRNTTNIEAYPTLLFYAPDGELVFKSIGFKDVNSFTAIAKFSADPNGAAKIKEQLADYNKGKKDYAHLPTLARTLREVYNDPKLSVEIASDYKQHYLDRLPLSEFLTVEHIQFIIEYGSELLNVKDRLFNAAYYQPAMVDSLIGEGSAQRLVIGAIYKDEIDAKLYKDGKPISNAPKWNEIYTNLYSEYHKLNADELIMNAKVNFYRKVENWGLYTKFKSTYIKKYPPKKEGMAVFFELNSAAWDTFLNCDDKEYLERALQWSNLAIQLEDNIQYLDTKANILYKLGKKKEAISLQEMAFERDSTIARKMGREYFYKYIRENLAKMKAGVPTWR